jgi:hypothetical protein
MCGSLSVSMSMCVSEASLPFPLTVPGRRGTYHFEGTLDPAALRRIVALTKVRLWIILPFAADDAHQMTWCCIQQRLCMNIGGRQKRARLISVH